MVEHFLAKEGVGGSNPLSRSRLFLPSLPTTRLQAIQQRKQPSPFTGEGCSFSWPGYAAFAAAQLRGVYSRYLSASTISRVLYRMRSR